MKLHTGMRRRPIGRGTESPACITIQAGLFFNKKEPDAWMIKFFRRSKASPRRNAGVFIVFAHVLFTIGSQGQNYLMIILSAPI